MPNARANVTPDDVDEGPEVGMWDIEPGFHWDSDTWEEDGIIVILVTHPGIVMEMELGVKIVQEGTLMGM